MGREVGEDEVGFEGEGSGGLRGVFVSVCAMSGGGGVCVNTSLGASETLQEAVVSAMVFAGLGV